MEDTKKKKKKNINNEDSKKKERHIVTWTPEEDVILRDQITLHGTENWAIIASKFKDKSTRQCRRRLVKKIIICLTPPASTFNWSFSNQTSCHRERAAPPEEKPTSSTVQLRKQISIPCLYRGGS
ncbi:unnamed protein product [Brassica oleracea]